MGTRQAGSTDAGKAIERLRDRLSADPHAAKVFATATSCADDTEFVEALLEHVPRWRAVG